MMGTEGIITRYELLRLLLLLLLDAEKRITSSSSASYDGTPPASARRPRRDADANISRQQEW
jgi:hypothetical protein